VLLTSSADSERARIANSKTTAAKKIFILFVAVDVSEYTEFIAGGCNYIGTFLGKLSKC
jgi:hypothetical protein